MICKYCGAVMPDQAVFCGQCGKAQLAEPAAQPEPAVAADSGDFVTPFEENGKLTCPVCGAKGQPKGRSRCWQCGKPFAEGVSILKPQSSTPPAAKPAPISYSRAAETDYRSIRESEKRENEKIEQYKSIDSIRSLLIVALILSFIASLLSGLCPVCSFGYKEAGYIYTVDSFTTVFALAGVILGPVLLLAFLICNDSRRWFLLWGSMFAHICTGSAIVAAFITFKRDHPYSYEAGATGWLGLFASLIALVMILIAIGRIKDQVQYLKMHMK